MVVNALYAVWIRIDNTMPYIELKGEYATRREAKQAAQQIMNKITLKIVNIPVERKRLKALAMIRTRR